jgi:hypothetical protein
VTRDAPPHARGAQHPAAASRGRFVVCALLVAALAPARLAAQPHDEPRADSAVERVVSGQVVRPVPDADPRGVPGVWVVLHRVGSDRAAPLDSVRTDARGGYTIRYRATGRADAIYFVSAEHGGIAYFGSPLTEPRVTGDEAVITVFDTTSSPLPIATRGRHIVVAAPRADGAREIIEVFELSNDTTLTLVSPSDDRPTFTTTIPDGALDFRAEQGEVAGEAMRERGGRVSVIAPIAPGLKQVGFRYLLPADRFPLSIPLAHGADVLEVLVEDTTTAVEGAKLVAEDPVATGGRTFRRWTATEAPRNAVVTITTRDAGPPGRAPLYFAAAALALGVAVLVALARAVRRRESLAGVTIERAEAPTDADRLARAIAELDRRFEGNAAPTSRQRAEYEAHRAELKRRLADALDARGGAT